MAYAALVSLMHVIEQVQLHDQLLLLVGNQVESLRQNISFLQDFAEDYSLRRNKEAEDLESRIRDTAHAAEDNIESHVVNYFFIESTSKEDQSSALFCQEMEIIIADMDFIKEQVMKIKENRGMKDQLLRNPTTAGSSRPPPRGKDTIVGFDEDLTRIMDELTGHESNRQIIPIVGMGGIGKTTLAKSAYDNLLIVQHFDIRAWITVSQEYSVREILLGLHETVVQKKLDINRDSDHRLGELLYKNLCGRRYLVVMDDMWNIEAWNEIQRFFPDNGNGSRIMVTTRLLNLADEFGCCSPYKMDFLGADESWKLFCNKIFPQESCPLELEEIGKKIARNCKGLPLAIVVIAGLLAKSSKTQEYWGYVEEDLTSIVNSENDEYCLKILSLSYNHLPIHLKPCFLYMGVFPEDSEISVSKLIKLWVAEGFLKPDSARYLEEVAEENLQDLIDRNLVLVSKRSRRGKIQTCGMHDLLRDICIREAQKERFFYATRISRLNISQGIENERRLSIHQSTMENGYLYIPALLSASLTRSFVCNFEGISAQITSGYRLLRVLDTVDKLSVNDFLQLLNSRYLACEIDDIFSSSVAHFRNLQTLIVKFPGCRRKVLPSEIWQMPQLRHLQVGVTHLPEPPVASCVLEKLQTLCAILNLRCTENVIRAIPNVKKLKFCCEEASRYGVKWPYYGINNLVRLHKLESVTCVADSKMFPGHLAFPCSLKRLNLYGCKLPWEEITIISSLPNLEVLKLRGNAFCGREWESTEGEFLRLKYLRISSDDWEHWIADSTHFPRLECLELFACEKLKEIPSGIGEIPTLQLIDLFACSNSAVASAQEILNEQRSFGNDVLQVRVKGRLLKLLDHISSRFSRRA